MDALFKKLNIKPKDIRLYKTAFSHSSYANEHKARQDYERLEFLGDAVVDLVVADYLYSNKKESEGEMTKVRASYVCENALYEYSMSLGLNKYIKVGHGEEKEGGKFKKAIVADIFEALVGAIYIEDPNIIFFSDYKSALQEYVQTNQKNLHYELIKEEGPAHNRIFTVQVKIDDIIYGTGVSTSKKEAEQEAAKVALEKLAV